MRNPKTGQRLKADLDSLILSTHYPENVQLITYERKYFFSDEQKMQSTEIRHL